MAVQLSGRRGQELGDEEDEQESGHRAEQEDRRGTREDVRLERRDPSQEESEGERDAEEEEERMLADRAVDGRLEKGRRRDQDQEERPHG